MTTTEAAVSHRWWAMIVDQSRPVATDAARRRTCRPPAEVKRPMVSFWIDTDLLRRLRACGKGWQTKVNATSVRRQLRFYRKKRVYPKRIACAMGIS